MKGKLILLLSLLIVASLIYLGVSRFPKPKEEIPKPDYLFKQAAKDTGYALMNENKVVGFKVLLGKPNSPKIPSGKFEVANGSLEFVLDLPAQGADFQKGTVSQSFPQDISRRQIEENSNYSNSNKEKKQSLINIGESKSHESPTFLANFNPSLAHEIDSVNPTVSVAQDPTSISRVDGSKNFNTSDTSTSLARSNQKSANFFSSYTDRDELLDFAINNNLHLVYQNRNNVVYAAEPTTSQGKDLVLWEDVLPNVDFNFVIVDNGLKGTIVIQTKDLAEKAIKDHEHFVIPFKIMTHNVLAKYDISGILAPRFIDKQTGDYRFHIQNPSLVDAKGVQYSVEAELKSLDETQYIYNIVLPRETLSQTQDIYPITVDFTIVDKVF